MYKSKVIPFLFLLGAVSFLGCSADVEGKPALQGDGGEEQDSKKSFNSSNMAMDPNKLMLGMHDKNKDGKISPDEFPDGGLDGYDYDGDGTITGEELAKRNKEISKGGLKAMESNPDEDKEVVK